MNLERSNTRAQGMSLCRHADLYCRDAQVIGARTMRSKSKLFCVLLLLLCTSQAQSLVAGATITGIVSDSATGRGLPGVSIRVMKTTLGKISTKSGLFQFRDLQSGSYQLQFSVIGYKTVQRSLNVQSGDSVFLAVSMVEQVLKTSEVVVSANKRLDAVQDVPLSIATVDAATISDRSVSKLDEVLRYVPGVNVAQGQVDIRGASGFAYGLGSRTMLLLDNFPMLSADNGDISFDALPMFSIDRIEVVKGPGSALYGSSAIGGVVNVLTKDATAEGQIMARVYGGFYTAPRFDSWKWTDATLHAEGLDASYARSFGETSIVAAGGIRADDNYTQFADSKRLNGYLKVSHTLNPNSQLMFFSQYAFEDRANWINWRSVEFATRVPLNTDTTIRVHSGKFALGAELRNIINENSFAVFRASLLRTAYNNTAAVDSASYLASTANALNTEGQFTTQINKKIALTIGMTLSANDVASSQTSGDKTQIIAAGYGQTEFSNLDDIIVTLGARLDVEKTRHENKNVEFSPKLGISYKAPTATNIRLSVGRSFRAPTIEERYADIHFAGFTVGHNVNLRPEHGWAFEMGAEQTFAINEHPLHLDLALFQSELYDLIEPQFNITAKTAEIQFTNLTRARIQGAELDLKTWVVDRLVGVESSITLMQPTDLTTNSTLMFRHNIMWTNRVLLHWREFEFQCDYRYLSRQEEVDERLVNLGLVVNGDVRVPVHVVDARIVWDMRSNEALPLKLGLNVRNLLDYYYVEIPGNLAPIRQISLQCEVTL